MRGLILALLIVISTSCYSVRYVAGPNQEVKVMAQTEYGKVKVQKRVWYALYGLIPLTDNSTADIIQRYDFKSVKVESKMTFIDFLLFFALNFLLIPTTVTTMTIEVEGEPAK